MGEQRPTWATLTAILNANYIAETAAWRSLPQYFTQVKRHSSCTNVLTTIRHWSRIRHQWRRHRKTFDGFGFSANHVFPSCWRRWWSNRLNLRTWWSLGCASVTPWLKIRQEISKCKQAMAARRQPISNAQHYCGQSSWYRMAHAYSRQRRSLPINLGSKVVNTATSLVAV